MKKGFLYLLMSTMLLIGMGTLNSCKDYEDDLLRDFNSRLDIESATLQKWLKDCQENCSTAIADLQKADEDLGKRIDELAKEDTRLWNSLGDMRTEFGTSIGALQSSIDAINAILNGTDLTSIYERLATVEAGLATANATLATLRNNVIELGTQVSGLETTVNNLNTTITNVKTELTEKINALESDLSEVTKKATEALTEADKANAAAQIARDSAYIAYQEAVASGLAADEAKKAADEADQKAEQTAQDLEEAKALFDEAISLLKKRADKLEERADDLEDRVINLEAAVLALQNEYKEADELLKEDIDALKAKVEDLEKKLDKVENSQKALVTSIELNATVNPIFGTFNLPADVRSNLLIGYYGKASVGGKFPSKVSDGFYVDDANAIDDATYELINPETFDYTSGLLVQGENGRLDVGTLYLTVNPTKANFDGTDFSLVNSKDEGAYATLSDLKASDYKIQFGYTRAAAAEESKNGFYETKVSIAKADVEKAALHVDGLADAAKSVLSGVKNRNGLNISDLATTILDNISGITDAYAVRATWDDELVGERSVYSQYGVAATAVRSFTGYSSFKDFHYQTLPGYEQAMNIIDRVANGIKNQIQSVIPDGLKEGFTIDLPEIKDLKLNRDELDLEKFGYSIDITIDFQINPEEGYADVLKDGDQSYLQIWAYDENGELKVVGLIPFGDIKKNPDGTYTISISAGHYEDHFTDEMNQILDAIDNAIDTTSGNIQEAYDQIEKLVADVNDLLKQLNDVQDAIDTGVDNFASKLQSWLDKINTKIVNLINSANYRLQPIMVATNANGTRLLSGAKNYPTVIPASTELILTNYTGEILAPAFKKYVACTNVFKGSDSAQDGNADCTSALQAVNESEKLNTVLDGSVVKIAAKGFKAGYTYELTIAALDYEGQQTARKFYVTVK